MLASGSHFIFKIVNFNFCKNFDKLVGFLTFFFSNFHIHFNFKTSFHKRNVDCGFLTYGSLNPRPPLKEINILTVVITSHVLYQ